MRSIAIALMVSLLCLFGLRFEALAGSLHYDSTTGGALKADATVRKIGKLSTPSGTVNVSGNRLDVIFGNADLTQKLTGTTINTHETDQHTITGTVIFTGGGATLDKLGDGHSTLVLNDGTDLDGTVTKFDDSSLTIETDTGIQTIPISSIHDVRSHRAFNFTMPFTGAAANATTTVMSFAETMTPLHAATTATTTTAVSEKTTGTTGECHLTKKRVLVTVALLAIVAVAVAVPVAVACGTHHHHNNNGVQLAEQQELLRSFLAQRTAASTTSRIIPLSLSP